MNAYLWRNLISFDQSLNTLFNGDPDETISSRAAKSRRKGHAFGCILCKLLDYIEKDHCEKSLEKDEGEPVSGP